MILDRANKDLKFEHLVGPLRPLERVFEKKRANGTVFGPYLSVYAKKNEEKHFQTYF